MAPYNVERSTTYGVLYRRTEMLIIFTRRIDKFSLGTMIDDRFMNILRRICHYFVTSHL